MTNSPLIIEQTLKATVTKVWTALTDNDAMKQWYFALPEFKPEVGFEFTFSGGKDDRIYIHHCRITEVVDQKKLTYSWRYEGVPGISHVTFELFPEGSNTRLKVTHEGLETFPSDNPDFAPSNFREGWMYIAGTSLKGFVEKRGC